MADTNQAGGRRRRRRVALVIGALVVVAGVSAAVYGARTAPARAQVGDCLSGQLNNADSVQRTDCASGAYRVIGRLENRSQSDFNRENCGEFASADAAFWEADGGDTGAILCLRAVRAGS